MNVYIINTSSWNPKIGTKNKLNVGSVYDANNSCDPNYVEIKLNINNFPLFEITFSDDVSDNNESNGQVEFSLSKGLYFYIHNAGNRKGQIAITQGKSIKLINNQYKVIGEKLNNEDVITQKWVPSIKAPIVRKQNYFDRNTENETIVIINGSNWNPQVNDLCNSDVYNCKNGTTIDINKHGCPINAIQYVICDNNCSRKIVFDKTIEFILNNGRFFLIMNDDKIGQISIAQYENINDLLNDSKRICAIQKIIYMIDFDTPKSLLYDTNLSTYPNIISVDNNSSWNPNLYFWSNKDGRYVSNDVPFIRLGPINILIPSYKIKFTDSLSFICDSDKIISHSEFLLINGTHFKIYNKQNKNNDEEYICIEQTESSLIQCWKPDLFSIKCT